MVRSLALVDEAQEIRERIGSIEFSAVDFIREARDADDSDPTWTQRLRH